DIADDDRLTRGHGRTAEAVAAREAWVGRRCRPIPANDLDLVVADVVDTDPAIAAEAADGGGDAVGAPFTAVASAAARYKRGGQLSLFHLITFLGSRLWPCRATPARSGSRPSAGGAAERFT